MTFIELTSVEKKRERKFLANAAAIASVRPPKSEGGPTIVVFPHAGTMMRVRGKEAYAEVVGRLQKAKAMVVLT